jgi:hypothetical protein
VWPKRKSILTSNTCNMSIMINDHLPLSNIFILCTRFETKIYIAADGKISVGTAETEPITLQWSFVLIQDFTHSSFQNHTINTLAAFYTKISACFVVFTTWRFFSSSHFYDRNKNISFMLAYNPQLILWYYFLYMKVNKFHVISKLPDMPFSRN